MKLIQIDERVLKAVALALESSAAAEGPPTQAMLDLHERLASKVRIALARVSSGRASVDTVLFNSTEPRS